MKILDYVDFGTGTNRKLISINDCYDNVGKTGSLGLMFFHSFTGCDSSSSFYDKPKGQWYKFWSEFASDELTSTFKKLSWCPSREDVDDSLGVLEQFVCGMYKFSSDVSE